MIKDKNKIRVLTLGRESVDRLILNEIKKSVRDKMLLPPDIYYDVEKKQFIITWMERGEK